MRKTILFKLIALVLMVALLTAAMPMPRRAVYAPNEQAALYNLPPEQGYELIFDASNLNFTVSNGTATWYSGRRASEDDGLNTQWAARVTDAVTIGYRNTSNNTMNERALSALKPEITVLNQSNSGFEAEVYLDTVDIGFTLSVALSGRALIMSIPYDSIKEDNDKYELMHLMLYPFFNSSYQQVQGSILIPDGSGALIDLNVKTAAKQKYSARVYGEDIGVSTYVNSTTAPYFAAMPVFGISYSSASSLSCIDSGDEYAVIEAYCDGIDTRYNWACAKYLYRQEYVKYYTASGAAGDSSVQYQAEKNQFDIVQTVYLLPEGGLSQMAQVYRQHLDALSLLPDNDYTAGSRLQFLMAESKQSLFGQEVVAMTTTEFLHDVISSLALQGSLSVSLFGYTRGGASNAFPDVHPLESKTGTKRDYKNLIELAKNSNVNLAFTADFALATSSSKTNRAMSMSEQFVTLGDSNQTLIKSEPYYLLTHKKSAELFAQYNEKLLKLGATAIDLTTLTQFLYSTHKKQIVSRSQAIEMLTQTLAQSQLAINADRPNQYAWRYVTSYLNTPTSNSAFLIESSSVPFMQMVLSGRMAMYSKAINLDYMGVHDVLKMIEYNVYPSYLLTEQDAIELYGTNSAYIFTSRYDIWQNKVKEIDAQVISVLSQVDDATFVGYTTLDDGVSKCDYSNGVSIIVNYNATDYNYAGVTVSALAATVINNG